MPRFPLLFAVVALLSFTSPAQAGDWPWWRGPDRNGVADPDQDPPVELNADANLKWSTPLPGRSHGSPAVVGDRIFLAVADENERTQAVHCFRRSDGEALWATVLHRDGMTQKSNKKASWASSSPACDGDRVYQTFMSGDAVFVTALDLNGQQLWQTRISGYVIHQGYGASPALYENLVIASADNKGGGALCGLDRETGEIVWRVDRGATENYPSPIILEIDGRDQLLMTGTGKVSSFDPLTGDTLWEVEGATTECATSTVTDGVLVFSSGGYPKNHVAAIRADGSGTIEWENNDRVYVPSMLIRDDHLYAVMDAGIAVCWHSATGEERWKARLGGNFSASPILVGDRIYAANEKGEVHVFRASPDKLDRLATSRVGDEIFASPVICGGDVFLRVANYQGETRQESLMCFGR